MFIDPATGELYEEGDIFTWESLGVTLQKIADGGSDEFYLGTTAVMLAHDIAEFGGNMTTEDLANYL